MQDWRDEESALPEWTVIVSWHDITGRARMSYETTTTPTAQHAADRVRSYFAATRGDITDVLVFSGSPVDILVAPARPDAR